MTHEDVARYFSGGPTRSGVHVSSDSAMRQATVFACVRVASEDVGKLRVFLYRRTANGGKEPAREHALFRLLHRRPNGWQTAYQFVKQLQAHIELRGNAFALITRFRGTIRELIPLHPDDVTVLVDDARRIRYRVGSLRETYPQGDILHLRGLSLDGVSGLNPIAYHRETVGLAMAAQEHGAQVFGNGAMPGVALMVPGVKLGRDQKAEIREDFLALYGGANRLGVGVFDQTMDIKTLALSNEDAQYIESRKFQRSEICAIYRVAPHKVADLDRSTNNNIEAQNTDHVVDTLVPRLTEWEQGLTTSLLTSGEQDDFFFEFRTEALLRGLTKERYEAYGIAIEKGFMNPNEARVRENMNPEPGLDEFRRPLNSEPVGGAT